MTDTNPSLQFSVFTDTARKGQMVLRANSPKEMERVIDELISTDNDGPSHLAGILNGIDEVLATVALRESFQVTPVGAAAPSSPAPAGPGYSSGQQTSGGGKQGPYRGWQDPHNSWATGKTPPVAFDGVPMIPMTGSKDGGPWYKGWCDAHNRRDVKAVWCDRDGNLK